MQNWFGRYLVFSSFIYLFICIALVSVFIFAEHDSPCGQAQLLSTAVIHRRPHEVRRTLAVRLVRAGSEGPDCSDEIFGIPVISFASDVILAKVGFRVTGP